MRLTGGRMKNRLTILMTMVSLISRCAMGAYNPELREVDVDVDANYDGTITDADDSIEMSAGGVVCVGGWTNIVLKQTITDAQPGDENKVCLSCVHRVAPRK